jgi:hypothetical protein
MGSSIFPIGLGLGNVIDIFARSLSPGLQVQLQINIGWKYKRGRMEIHSFNMSQIGGFEFSKCFFINHNFLTSWLLLQKRSESNIRIQGPTTHERNFRPAYAV